MATKQISFWDGLFYMYYKNTQVGDDDDVMRSISDIQVDFTSQRFTITFDNEDVRTVGFKDIVLMDIDGATLETSHSGSEQQKSPNQKRLKNRKRKP